MTSQLRKGSLGIEVQKSGSIGASGARFGNTTNVEWPPTSGGPGFGGHSLFSCCRSEVPP